MSKHWNDEMIELERADNLTGCQSVDAKQSIGGGMERWDLQWEVERLKKVLAERDQEIGMLRFEKMMLKAELNSVRGKRNET